MCDDSKFHKECLHQIKLLIFPMDNLDSILDVMMDNRFHVSNTSKTGKPFFSIMDTMLRIAWGNLRASSPQFQFPTYICMYILSLIFDLLHTSLGWKHNLVLLLLYRVSPCSESTPSFPVSSFRAEINFSPHKINLGKQQIQRVTEPRVKFIYILIQSKTCV